MIKNGCFWLLAAVAVGVLPVGCSTPQQAYYVSPFNGNNSDYHTLPKQGDSVHAALYGGASFIKGTANNKSTDDFYGVHANLYAGHSYTNVQLYYGGSLSAGSYDMGHWSYSPAYPTSYQGGQAYYANTDQLNTYSGGHSFGGVGFQGGINGVVPVGIGEWRLLGVETSVMHEWGNYLSTRRQMPDSIATLINRNATFATMGITSELVAHVREGEFGFRWAYGIALSHGYANPGVYDNQSGGSLHYNYFNFTFHYTHQRVTGYFQLNEATKSSGGQVGVNFRLTGGS